MVVKIAHLADLHLPKSIKRHEEYKLVFNELIVSLRANKPDRIVIVGDLFNDYIKIEGELLVLTSKLLNALSKIAPVVITRGNHDVLKAASNRIDSIEAVVYSLANPNITYLNTTGMIEDENIVWCVWKHGEKRNNPWPKDFVKDNSKRYIDLFHDPVNGCLDANGFEFDSKTYRSISDFRGCFSLFGDIHKHQYFALGTKAYSGSLIAQNYSEGDDEFHGYILWDVTNGSHIDVPVKNIHNFHTIVVNRFTDFDDLNIEIPNLATKPSIRVKWQTLPATKSTENERKLWKYLSDKFAPVSYKHKNEFLEENKVDIQENSVIENITKRDVLHQIFTEYLTKIGHEDDVVQAVLELDEKIEARLVVEQLTNIQWSIVKFWGRNFRNIKTLDIDWRDKDGLYQITGKNTAGKSSIIQLLSYVQHGKTIETDSRKKNGDARFVNNRSAATSCEGGIVIECNGEYYGIKRVTTISKNKEGEISKVSTVVNHYKLNSPDDEFSNENNLEKLNEEDRIKTQRRINEIIGTYENFVRITLTTAASLNTILTTDSSVFLDSILADSGLDVFDQRLQEFKAYKKELIAKDRVVCNIENELAAISQLELQIEALTRGIASQENGLSNYDVKINEATGLKDKALRGMHQIDPELSKLNSIVLRKNVDALMNQQLALKTEQSNLASTIASLRENFDSERLAALMIQRDNHKTEEFKLRTEINNLKIAIEQTTSLYHRHNGDIELLKRDGKAKKAEIKVLNESKNCPTCGVEKTADTVNHIQEKVKSIEEAMFSIGNQIKVKMGDKTFETKIAELNANIKSIEKIIGDKSVGFEGIVLEIGELSNEKQEVEKREKLRVTFEGYPVKIENLELRIQKELDTIKRVGELKDKIEHNAQLESEAKIYIDQVRELQYQKDVQVNAINQSKNDILYHNRTIEFKKDLIKKFRKQELENKVMDIYVNCVHRDGVPTQILRNYLLPKINNTLSDFLQPVDFNVWLDEADLRLKMSYATHPTAIIECIGGSGKERTFSSISLRVALNEINIKSKPTLFMLDEVMGMLREESIDQFLEFVNLLKKKIKKVIIIEQNHEINPDYIISAVVDSNKISTITLEN